MRPRATACCQPSHSPVLARIIFRLNEEMLFQIVAVGSPYFRM